jgi:hypothetical protein
MILVVIDLFSAIPVFVPDDCASLPFLVLDVRMVVVMVLGLVERIVSAKTVCSFLMRNSCCLRCRVRQEVLFVVRCKFLKYPGFG